MEAYMLMQAYDQSPLKKFGSVFEVRHLGAPQNRYTSVLLNVSVPSDSTDIPVVCDTLHLFLSHLVKRNLHRQLFKYPAVSVF